MLIEITDRNIRQESTDGAMLSFGDVGYVPDEVGHWRIENGEAKKIDSVADIDGEEPLSVLGLGESIQSALEEAGYEAASEVWACAEGESLEDIEGIGPSRAKKIEQAVSVWWEGR